MKNIDNVLLLGDMNEYLDSERIKEFLFLTRLFNIYSNIYKIIFKESINI